MGSINCVILGTISKSKGYDRAIAVIEKNPKINLLIVGPLWNPAEQSTLDFIKEKEKTLPNLKVEIKFLNEQDFKDYSKKADIILLPYQVETASGIFSQVLSSMKPIITWDLPFFKEYEQKYRVCITVNSVEELEKKILEAAQSKLLQGYLKKGITKVLEECSWKSVAKNHLNLYEGVMK